MHSLSRSLLLLTAAASLASAQSAAPGPPVAPAAKEAPINLEDFVVTASPFSRAQDEVAAPTTVLAGPRLDLRRQPSLGETLAAEPGVSSTYFGPGASRPVIRGLGGDRIRVLASGVGTLDASVVSPDHAVSLDPLLVDRVEIVRGPATLLYGGSAVGGVVNVIDTRIPDMRPAAPLTGRFEARLGSAAEERSRAGVLVGHAGPLVWRLDGFRRDTADLRIPGFAEAPDRLAEHNPVLEGPPARGRLPNSATAARGAAFGAAWVEDAGHVGFSYNGFNSLYGVPGHEHHPDDAGPAADAGVRVDLRQRRWDFHGEWLRPVGALRAARFQLGLGDYRHDEMEGVVVGTRFKNRSHEGRLELLHERFGAFEGALGAQLARSDFAAAGAEAFVPPSVTDNRAVFLFEEAEFKPFTWQLGTRVERQRIAPVAASGRPARRHNGASFSGGLVYAPSETWTVSVSLSRSERLPNAQELFADGPHAGTGAYEIGDAALANEVATGLDVSLRRRSGHVTGAFTVFVNRFAGYIFELATGAVDPEHGLPVYRFVQHDARTVGAETELIVHLHEAKSHRADLRLTADTVQALDRTGGRPLPRTTPSRLGVAFDWRAGAFSGTLGARRADRARRLAPAETPTAGYTLVEAGVVRHFSVARLTGEVFARVANATDVEARVHTSFLKDVAPLAGRDLTVGLRVGF
jgi:iron complex outermembrane receptor protein